MTSFFWFRSYEGGNVNSTLKLLLKNVTSPILLNGLRMIGRRRTNVLVIIANEAPQWEL